MSEGQACISPASLSLSLLSILCSRHLESFSALFFSGCNTNSSLAALAALQQSPAVFRFTVHFCAYALDRSPVIPALAANVSTVQACCCFCLCLLSRSPSSFLTFSSPSIPSAATSHSSLAASRQWFACCGNLHQLFPTLCCRPLSTSDLAAFKHVHTLAGTQFILTSTSTTTFYP